MDKRKEVIEKLKGKQKFIVLSRDFYSTPKKQFSLYDDVYAESQEEAWEIVEEEIATNNSQDWLMTEEEFEILKEMIK
jgi:hypothetical protein